MLVRNRISLVVLSLAAGLASASPGYAEYRVTIVGPANSQPTAINAAGAVVGIVLTGTLTYRSFVNYGQGVHFDRRGNAIAYLKAMLPRSR